MKLIFAGLPLFFSSIFVNADEDSYTGPRLPGTRSTLRFNDWIGPFEYQGVKLVAHGGDEDTIDTITPEETLGCTVYQPPMDWKYDNYVDICELVNSLGFIDTDCANFDDDEHGGLCNNGDYILTYENWGPGFSSGPDVWAHSDTFSEETGVTCHSQRRDNGCTFPTDDSCTSNIDNYCAHDCESVSHTWSVFVYACQDFDSNAQTYAPAAKPTISSIADMIYYIFDQAGIASSVAINMMSHGCYCPALNYEYGTTPVWNTNAHDGLDMSCKYHFRCSKCVEKSTCHSDSPYPYTLDNDGAGGFDCSDMSNDDCGRDQCYCDLHTATTLLAAADHVIVPAPVCQASVTNFRRGTCCGLVPIFAFYNPDTEVCDDDDPENPLIITLP